MSFLYLSKEERRPVWQECFARELPDLPFLISEADVGDPADIRYIAAWTLPEGFAERYPNLEVMFSVGAGIDQLGVSDFPPQVRVVRMLEPGIRAMMCEYVAMATLALHRDLPQYLLQQRGGEWLAHKARPAVQRRIGILGLGNLGQGVLNTLRPFGFQLLGWSRSEKDLEGVTCFSGKAGLTSMLEQTDILVCLLPLTDATAGLLDAELFGRLPTGSAVIHVGRGQQLDHDALVSALDSGQLSAAFVDVTKPEPLPRDHPFWSHPRLILTPHIASQTNDWDSAAHVIAGIQNHQRGLPIDGEIDRTAGY